MEKSPAKGIMEKNTTASGPKNKDHRGRNTLVFREKRKERKEPKERKEKRGF